MRASRGCWLPSSGRSAIPSGALVLTFDNLGEATELERGGPLGAELGEHPSVTEALPWLLDVLDAFGLRGTFFVEGLNCELYPDEVRSIADRGHELGMHGWRHEEWSRLSADRERSVLERCVRAFGSLGLSVSGFFSPRGGGGGGGAGGRLLPDGVVRRSARRARGLACIADGVGASAAVRERGPSGRELGVA